VDLQMLRFDYMASDFNPQFLVLGDHADLAELAATLRRYASGSVPIDLSKCFPNPAMTASLILTPADAADQGLRQTSEASFRWGLASWQASVIADSIEALSGGTSGSEVFSLGAEGEIPVKVSKGEFTDDFLVTRR